MPKNTAAQTNAAANSPHGTQSTTAVQEKSKRQRSGQRARLLHAPSTTVPSSDDRKHPKASTQTALEAQMGLAVSQQLPTPTPTASAHPAYLNEHTDANLGDRLGSVGVDRK